jgi:hypothetical protein
VVEYREELLPPALDVTPDAREPGEIVVRSLSELFIKGEYNMEAITYEEFKSIADKEERRETLKRMLELCAGNRTALAEYWGVKRYTIDDWVFRLGLSQKGGSGWAKRKQAQAKRAEAEAQANPSSSVVEGGFAVNLNGAYLAGELSNRLTNIAALIETTRQVQYTITLTLQEVKEV